MKNKIVLFVLLPILVFSFFSCGLAKKMAVKKAKKKAKSELLGVEGVYRLTVSFFSIGSGVDGKAKQAFETALADFEKDNNIKIAFETSKWGREGEVDFCFKLDELSSKQQTKLIKSLEASVKDSKLVRFSENSICKKRQN